MKKPMLYWKRQGCKAGAWGVQGKMVGKAAWGRVAAAATVGMMCSAATAQNYAPTTGSATTSPLSILQQAPRVRLDDPPPQYPDKAVPLLQPPPPPQETGRRPIPPQPAPPGRVYRDEDGEMPEPEEKKKPGVIRGAIRAIPFIGKKIAGPGEEEPEQERDAEKNRDDDVVPAEPEEGRPTDGVSRPVLVPPPDSEVRSYEYPPIPRPPTPTPAAMDAAPTVPPDAGAPTLSVKPARPIATAASTTASAVTAPTPQQGIAATPTPRKQPALADVSTTAAATPAPAVAAAPTATPAPAAAVADVPTTPSLEGNDLGLPNPAYEQNEVNRAEYTEAVKTARAEKYAEAATLFRDYAENHPSSGLAPRALFLATLLQSDPAKAAESYALLKERFPTSPFIKQIEKRTQGRLGAAATPPPIPADEPPQQTAARLETELTNNVGNPDQELPLRLQLGQAYMRMEEYERALEVLRPAQEASRDKPQEPEILVLISECMIATGNTQQAVNLLSDVIQRYPAAPQRPRATYDLGLIYEASGNYARARAMYNEVRQQWSGTAEGEQAIQRLKDLDRLAE